MNINIRDHIKTNFKKSTEEDIRSSIDDGVGDEDEITLPGLGVFFEILWNNSSEDEKRKIVSLIKLNI